MTFQIVSVGWRCAGWWERTLRSIEAQTVDDWCVQICYDGGDDAGDALQQWCDERDERWHCTVNSSQLFAVENQHRAIQQLAPKDDDVIVFLDLDGDQLAHPDVLAHLADYYADGVLLTYGNYKPVPYAASCPAAVPFPPAVIAGGSYRKHMLTGACCFNHLRTMKGVVAKAIPEDHFRWPSGLKAGQWYDAGTDYIFMVAGLELAGGRHRCISEVLLLYNNANPNADYLSHPAEADACVQNYLRRPPLKPLAFAIEERAVPDDESTEPVAVPYLPPEERRAILRDYGRRFGLRVFIETGTNDGGTPWELKDDFDQLFTIELGQRPWREAVRKFKHYPQVHCLLGDSAVMLPQSLALVHEPALIWLDGHWSGGDTARGSQDTPVLDELEAIFATGLPHIVLVDDARLFDGMPLHDEQPNWPHIDEIRRLVENYNYDFVLEDDIIRLTPQ